MQLPGRRAWKQAGRIGKGEGRKGAAVMWAWAWSPWKVDNPAWREHMSIARYLSAITR